MDQGSFYYRCRRLRYRREKLNFPVTLPLNSFKNFQRIRFLPFHHLFVSLAIHHYIFNPYKIPLKEIISFIHSNPFLQKKKVGCFLETWKSTETSTDFTSTAFAMHVNLQNNLLSKQRRFFFRFFSFLFFFLLLFAAFSSPFFSSSTFFSSISVVSTVFFSSCKSNKKRRPMNKL